ncbi:MAG: hypothetical protein JNK15_24560 [Planctomycetes bacterium]|nr:hypothetical protein [Planctomycetota bacterium]
MPNRTTFWTIAAVAVVAAVAQSWVLRWTCDDAFISIRYALHFVEGHGLVFNLDPDEAPVEGYTNFLWTLWLALGLWLGCTGDAIESWGSVWGTLAHGGVVWLLAAIAWRQSGGTARVPIAACGYAAIHHAASLAPAGLETALFVLLVTAMVRLCLRPGTAATACHLGLLGVAAATTRPDGAIPVAMAGLFVLADARAARSFRPVLAYALPFLVLFVPYLLWRHAYYGYWVPNTFFAKSGSDPFWSAGWRYVVDFLLCYWPLLLAMAALPVGFVRAMRADGAPRPWLGLGTFVGSYLAFVLWVGGDFMFGRFLLPILPALLLGLDFLVARASAAWLSPVVAGVVVLGCVFRIEPPGLGDPKLDVSDNRRITFAEFVPGISWNQALHVVGDYLRPLFAGLDVRIAIGGGHANIATRAHVPVAVEVAAGLTDAHIARLPVPVRGKRGHDKPRDVAYLVRRRVQFHSELDHEGQFGVVDTWRDVMFTPVGWPMRLVTWDRELMRELKRRDPSIQFTDFEQFLDGYLADLPNKTKDQVRADFAKFEPFYFARNADPARRAQFDAFLR